MFFLRCKSLKKSQKRLFANILQNSGIRYCLFFYWLLSAANTENKGIRFKATVVNSTKFFFYSLSQCSFSFPPSLLPSPFSQLLSASPRRVQGSISFNNLHIHDSHREWHPAGLDHRARTPTGAQHSAPAPPLLLSHRP